MKFRILVGKHREYGREYKKGEIVDSKSDLSKHNRPDVGSIKFERVEDNTLASEGTPYARLNFGPTPHPAEVAAHAAAMANAGPASSNPKALAPTINKPNLDSMSIKDLQDWAAAQEIDVKGASNKNDLLRAIRAAG